MVVYSSPDVTFTIKQSVSKRERREKRCACNKQFNISNAIGLMMHYDIARSLEETRRARRASSAFLLCVLVFSYIMRYIIMRPDRLMVEI
jgi:hypothetical protein